ncbi:hypothetical protein LDENG_00130180, partial [Lucifuga dentata]
MYSVEDLLISHGYKLPQHADSSSASTPAPAPTSSSHQAHSSSSSSLPSYGKHHEILENRPRTANGYERASVVPFENSGANKQPQMYGVACPNNNNDAGDRSQSRREGETRGQIDTHSLGESLTSDSGFCDGTRGPQSQSKDVSYWRRRGQDFSLLLDYPEFRDAHGGEGGYGRPEAPQQPRGQEPSAEERQRAVQQRQRWAAQARAQVQAQAQAQAQARSREREAALHQWRTATERKCQSLGTYDWRPAVSFGRQLSQSEGDRWAQEQQRLHARTPEGMVIHPRTKVKSQSLPRMLQPDSLHYMDMASSGQELYRRVSGLPLSHHDLYRAPHWPENGRPASATQLSMTPKPRFTRPPRPPSYEMHQQIRGSCDMLSGRDSTIPQARDRTPLPFSRTGDSQLDYFAQDSGPPGYIPPPSYKRAPVMGGGHQIYGEIAVDYRYRDMYQQIQVAPDGSHWFARHPACSWPESQRQKSTHSQKQLYPVFTTQESHSGGVQYIPFDDPRIRHISSALGSNSLTDADKIRHMRNELPSITMSEPASENSAFLPPPLGPFITAKLADDANQRASTDFDNDNNRWHHNLHKETVDNFPATDQNCNNRYPKSPLPSPSSLLGSSSDQVFAETITQVKKIVPDLGPENRNSKKRVSETIFCLVSVPIHTPTNINKGSAADPNNNETIPSLTVTNTGSITVGHIKSQKLRSKSATDMSIKPLFYTSSMSSMRNYKRAPLRKEIIDAWALQASEGKELCYAGSWPGNQYRNQETQTGSPLTVVKSPEPQSPPGGQKPVQSASDTTTDSNVGTDKSSFYGNATACQNNLYPSSNSAFSRLNISTAQLQELPSPSKEEWEEGDQQPSSPSKSNCNLSDGAEQVAFGQFLLKPVNRRPWDAIGELECFNKELQDTISKRPNVDQRTEELDEVHMELDSCKSIVPSACLSTGREPDVKAASLPPTYTDIINDKKGRSESWDCTTDLDLMDMKSVFSQPQANSIQSKNYVSIPDTDPTDNCLSSSLHPHNDSNQLYRQDIPVPQESLLRDVGLTVYTETPARPGELIQRSLSVPSTLDHKELRQSSEMSWESRTALVKNSGRTEHSSSEELQGKMEAESRLKADNTPQFRGELNLNICGTRSEKNRSPTSEGSPHTSSLTRKAAFVFEDDDDGDDRYAISKPLSYRNESTIADKHLENLLIQEKANALPTEDLSILYEVKCGKGIPENESIEERAARILGIAVPVESLGVADKEAEDNQIDLEMTVDEETQQVSGTCEQVNEESLSSQGSETKEVMQTGSDVVLDEGEERQNQSNLNDNEDSNNTETQSAVVLDLPEFPPSKLLLSLPIIPDEKLVLSMCSGDKKGRGGASKLIESLQNKLSTTSSSSTASLGRSTPDRMARLKELDSVSRIRRLSLKSLDSGGDADSEERGAKEKAKEVAVEKREEEEHKNLGMGKMAECEKVYETCDTTADPEEDCKPKEENEGVYEKENQRHKGAEEINVEIGLKAENERCKGEADDLQTEDPEGEMELKIVEDAKPKPLEKMMEKQNTAEVSREEGTQHAEEEVPKPKQRTRFQKPPLLPKPRSVPKREITLPRSLSSETCSSSNMEGEEMISVS